MKRWKEDYKRHKGVHAPFESQRKEQKIHRRGQESEAEATAGGLINPRNGRGVSSWTDKNYSQNDSSLQRLNNPLPLEYLE